MKSKKEMIRILRTESEGFVVDATGRKNGRGAYLCPSMECFKKAVKNKGLERSFKMAVPNLWKRRWNSLENRQKVLNMIGLATKAGKTVSGEFSTEKAVKTGKAWLVIVSEEASDNTRKMFTNMCTYYHVPVCFFGKKEELGHSMGKEFRASLAITDEGFAKTLVKQMNENGGSKYESQ